MPNGTCPLPAGTLHFSSIKTGEQWYRSCIMLGGLQGEALARMFHELLTATTDMAILPGVLGCRPLRRTVLVCLGSNTLRLPGGTAIFVVS